MQTDIYRKNTYGEFGKDGLFHIWNTPRLWALAAQMPVKRVYIDQIENFNQACWFPEGMVPTCRAVTEHAKRIFAATFEHPIILSAEGHVMDGMHRIARAWLDGLEEIDAVQFEVNPEPDDKVQVKEK